MGTPSKEEIWKQRVADWKASGQSPASWCLGKDYSKSALGYWKRRFYAYERKGVPSGFSEIEDKAEEGRGILLTIKGVEIHLENGFDEGTLARCLKVLWAC